MLVRRLYCPIPEEARSPHECLGETLCGFGSRRPHQWNDGAICEAANLAATDDLRHRQRQGGAGLNSVVAWARFSFDFL